MIGFGTKRNKQKLFLISSDNVNNKAHILIYKAADWMMSLPLLPLLFLSMTLYLQFNKKFPKHCMGVVLLANQARKLEHLPMHNARNAFFRLCLPQSKVTCKDQGIKSRCVTLPPTSTDLIRAISEKNTGKPITDFELQGISALRCVKESSEIPSF